MKRLIDYIKQKLKIFNEDFLGKTADIYIDTSLHSEERYFRQYHKHVSPDDLLNRLTKLSNTFVRLFYIDNLIKDGSNIIIIDKTPKPNFVMVCSVNYNKNLKRLKIKVITEIFKNNFKSKYDNDYILETYL